MQMDYARYFTPQDWIQNVTTVTSVCDWRSLRTCIDEKGTCGVQFVVKPGASGLPPANYDGASVPDQAGPGNSRPENQTPCRSNSALHIAASISKAFVCNILLIESIREAIRVESPLSFGPACRRKAGPCISVDVPNTTLVS